MSIHELKYEIWEGKIPIVFTMATDDISTNFTPKKVYDLVSRYLPLQMAAETIITYFQSKAIEFSPDIWFESSDIQLPSHIPIGVLFDAYRSNALAFFEPWHIIIRFQKNTSHFPSNNIFTTERNFFHSLKQSVFLMWGNTRAFNEMQSKTQTLLWNSLKNNDWITFQNCTNELIPKILRHIPIKVISDKGMIFQPLVRIEEKQLSLGEFLSNFLHEKLISSKSYVIQGISPLPIIPIFDIWSLFHHVDFYLYIILKE